MAGTHTVREGDGLDSLWKISRHYKVSFAEIKALNPQIMERHPVSHPHHGWIYPGDVIKLPAQQKNEDEPVRKTKEDCAKHQALEVIAVALTTQFTLCEPAMFKVTKYKGKPTEADKKRIKWMLRDASDKSDLKTQQGVKVVQKGEKLIIDCVPFTWREKTIQVAAQFDKEPTKKMVDHKATTHEVHEWIATIEKAEAAYPAWSSMRMTDAMRRLAGYDDIKFQTMYGGSKPAPVLQPIGGLANADIHKLEAWTKHSSATTGLVTDSNGERFAAGHVLTGISAGFYREKRVDVTPWYSGSAGEKMDNLYSTTISGDLGQAAVFVELKKQKKPYIGSHGDADDEEIIGDLDGFNIGRTLPRGGSTAKLSDILLRYYCGCVTTNNYRQRIEQFLSHGKASLKDEVRRFAYTYVYAAAGKLSGLVTEVTTEAAEATAEFDSWSAARLKIEKTRNTTYQKQRSVIEQ